MPSLQFCEFRRGACSVSTPNSRDRAGTGSYPINIEVSGTLTDCRQVAASHSVAEIRQLSISAWALSCVIRSLERPCHHSCMWLSSPQGMPSCSILFGAAPHFPNKLE